MKSVQAWLSEKEADEWERLKSKLKTNDYRLLKACIRVTLREPEKARELIVALWFFACMFSTQVGFLVLVGMG